MVVINLVQHLWQKNYFLNNAKKYIHFKFQIVVKRSIFRKLVNCGSQTPSDRVGLKEAARKPGGKVER